MKSQHFIILISILILCFITDVTPICSCNRDVFLEYNLLYDGDLYCSTFDSSITPSSSCIGPISASEYDALADFYDATYGKTWNISVNKWNFNNGESPCSISPWYGITCGYAINMNTPSSNCTITSLSFDSDVIIAGTLPASIGNLSNLELLELNSNNIFSSIPTSLKNLTQLKLIDLGNNCLSGSFPKFDSHVLQVARLEFNCLTGPIGISNEELWNTSNSFQCLSIAANYINGTIPLFNNMSSSIKELDLSLNFLSGTIPILQLPKLLYLNIAHNSISGTIDSGINLPSLIVLNAGFNDISGVISQEIFHSFQNTIKVINLMNNNLTGNIPELELKLLEELSLAFNYLSGHFPTSLNLPNLEILSLGYNYLDGRLDLLNITFPHLKILELSSNYFEGNYYDFNSLNLTYVAIGNNKFNGTLPDTIPNELLFLDVGVNYFTGHMPCYNSTNLLYLNISYNYLSESFPVMNTPFLKYLIIYNNNIDGNLVLRDYKHLEYLDAGDNLLTGLSIPYTSEYNYSLKLLYLSQNFISESGYILNALQNITSLFYLDISENEFYGQFPSLSHENLKQLYIYNNYFTGPIPYIELHNLTTFIFANNYFNSSLGSKLSHMRHLRVIDFSNNSFTGEFPTLSENSSLLYVIGRGNYLSGKIPPDLFRKSLILLDLSHNNLTGEIPDSIANSDNLLYFIADNNMLYGSFPKNVSQYIQYIDISENYFNFVSNGSDGFSNLLHNSKYLIYLDIHDNFIQGEINLSKLSYMIDLKEIDFSDNLFSSIIYDSLRNKSAPNFNSLSVLNISYNKISGEIEELFQYGELNELYQIDLTHNRLTGNIPSNLFYSPKLTYVLLGDNCFFGPLSSSVCTASNLKVMILDGASSGSQCDTYFPNGIDILKLFFHVRGRFVKQKLGGSIPSCLWSLPELSTLHLSGNGITGTLSNIEIGNTTSKLIDLNLAVNSLTGVIPQSIQQKGFQQLDLSNNRIGGELNYLNINKDCTNSTLKLGQNRLSGKLSDRVINDMESVTNLDILQGNFFGCGIFGLQKGKYIPKNDIYYNEYSCLGTNLNISTLSCGIIVLIGLIIYLYYYIFVFDHALINSVRIKYLNFDTGKVDEQNEIDTQSLDNSDYSRSFDSTNTTTSLAKVLNSAFYLFYSYWCYTIQLYYDTSEKTAQFIIDDVSEFVITKKSLYRCRDFLVMISRCCVASVIILAFYIFVCLICYVVMKQIHGTVYDEMFSFTYIQAQSGWTYTSVFLHGAIPVFLLLLFFIISASVFKNAALNTEMNEMAIKKYVLYKKHVYDQLHKVARSLEDKYLLYFIWRKILLPISVNAINIIVTVIVNYYYISEVINGANGTDLTVAQLWIALFKAVWSNVYLPGAMVLLHRNNTPKNHLFIHYTFMAIFNNILIPVLVTLFTDSTCLNGLIVGEEAVSASFVSTYEDYNFKIQANVKSYAILSYNTPTIESNTTTKIFQSLLTPAWSYSYVCSSSIIRSYAPLFLFSYTIFGILIPAFNYIVLYASACGYTNSIWKKINSTFFVSTIWSSTIYDDLKLVKVGMSSRKIDDIHQANISNMYQTIARMRPLFLSTSVIGHLFLHFSVLLTFGLTTPWLAVIICITILNEALIWRLIIGRYLMKVNEFGKMNDVVNYARLEEACRINPNGIKLCLLFVLIVSVLFWACIIYDPIADTYSDVVATNLSTAVAVIFIFISFLLVYSDDIHKKMKVDFKNITYSRSNEVTNPIIADMSINRISKDRVTTQITLNTGNEERFKRKEEVFSTTEENINL